MRRDRDHGWFDAVKVSVPGRTPDFVGFGVHRSGTTWLNGQLRQHPEIWTPPTVFKEVHYFDELHVPQHASWHTVNRVDPLIKWLKRVSRNAKTEADLRRVRRFAELGTSDRDDDWYRALFGLSGPQHKVVGEITPAYSLMNQDGFDHVKRLNHEMKVFLVLRDPANRIWSHLKLQHKAAIIDNPSLLDDEAYFQKALQRRGVIERTEYRRIIESLRNTFAADRIHINFFDRVAEEPQEMLADFANFLGVDPSGFTLDGVDKPQHSSPDGAVPPWLRAWTNEHLGDDLAWLASEFDVYPARWINAS